MKVLIISASFPPLRSGGADYAFWLCRNLAESGHEVSVVTSRIPNVATHPGVRLYPVMRRWSWHELPRLLRILRQVRPDVIDLHFAGPLYHDHPMVTLLPALLKRLVPSLRFVTHIEWPIPIQWSRTSLPVRGIRKVFARWLGEAAVDYGYGAILRDSDRLIILSSSHSALLAEHEPGVDAKCVLLPPPPNTRMAADGSAARLRSREQLGVDAEEFLFAYYGYLCPGKGLETLLETFRLVTRDGRAVRLVLIGGSNEVMLKELNRPRYVEELRDRAEQLGIAGRLIWTGYCPSRSDQASLYLRGADACVLPFDAGVYLNNSSFAVAAAHGLPIVTTKGQMLEFPFVDRENVLLCPPQDPLALADVLHSLLGDPGLLRRLRAGSLELAREWFSWERNLERTVAIFQGTEQGRWGEGIEDQRAKRDNVSQVARSPRSQLAH